jgi:(1->4)-alpha-D-glucan 1-alpha-D-glucosylmutase
MAVGTPDNAWWWDVLENGPASPYAPYFDVDWNVGPDNRVLLPILGERYADSLEAGLVRVHRDGQRFLVRYYEHAWPAAPRSLAGPLRAAALAEPGLDDKGVLGFLADALEGLPAPSLHDFESLARRRRDKQVIFDYLGRLFADHEPLAAAVDRELERLNGDVEALDAWLEQQNWRLAHWQNAATDLSYRRFFDVNTLAGLRVEDPRVFASSHQLILRWLADGSLDGVRVDHPDGLRDPEEYMVRLRSAAPDAWIVVEKILHEDELLPASWPVAGTTGYDFMRLLDQVFVDPRGEGALTELATRYAGGEQRWDVMADAAKRQILTEVLASECHRIGNLAHHLLVGQLTLRDCSWREVTRAVTELLASYAAYRSYVRVGSPITPTDATLIAGAVATAAQHAPEIDPRIWSTLERALCLQLNSGAATEFALRLQQVTGAVTAKSIEDTLFYRYVRLLGLNEVGGSPQQFGLSVDGFHRVLAQRAQSQPLAMLGSSTHDTKRGEDMRARLLVLSEVAPEWTQAVERWSARAKRHRGELVDSLTEYFFYQTLVGAYPLSPERAWRYMEKAIREAKLATSWTRPAPAYEAAVQSFVHGVLGDGELMADIEAFVQRIARPGFIQSLARTLIKLCAPGIPDLYQGSELWDLSLVDPDNRAPVDYDLRRKLLARMPEMSPEQSMQELALGTPKFWLTWRVLQLRSKQPQLFAGSYEPLALKGPDEARALGFVRNGRLAVVVPRLSASGELTAKPTLVGLPEGSWRNALTGERVESTTVGASLQALWARFPVALLQREE